jgi:hypothetical protein
MGVAQHDRAIHRRRIDLAVSRDPRAEDHLDRLAVSALAAAVVSQVDEGFLRTNPFRASLRGTVRVGGHGVAVSS